ncbi:GTPase HflX [Desulfobotulus sp. H1]|uniref:GTPase HflX n=1 Tax=Desulfobotulus pelophilus TaxID=2823377 RepID=A0ABT3N800_9BACT|nr:GTPase HflX [Desulfobotulus pelophilus]MCW7753583.1 GTPase HflX [Desulfobotulus pelophilus]
MANIFGNTTGLKTRQIKRLESLYNQRVPQDTILPPDLADELCLFSRELNRQIGLAIDRGGKIVRVIAGDAKEILIPDLSDFRTAPGRLRGVRIVHTHLNGEPLTEDDLTDLALLRLDLICALCTSRKGELETVHVGHVLPGSDRENPCRVFAPGHGELLENDCLHFILELEDELSRSGSLQDAPPGVERAILVGVSSLSKAEAEAHMAELKELAQSCGVHVIRNLMQTRQKPDPKTLMGQGKLKELYLMALQDAATLIIFDQELSPAQVRNVSDRMELKVMDRTQLILDIFARRAQTREGKLQVELAQLKYLQPRLTEKNTAMSRLTGGIGGRGPGETKLEINRRRVREQILRLEKDVSQIQSHRRQQKARRNRMGLPVFSIVGYTNAGKSTLLNAMTQSKVTAKDQMFATLDPTSRRLRFPQDVEVIITDTVGFIRNLPKELVAAFRATLEELEGADILLHVVDIASPSWEKQLASVDGVLEDLGLSDIPQIRVFNKKDLALPEEVVKALRQYGGITVSALDRSSLRPLLETMQKELYARTGSQALPVCSDSSTSGEPTRIDRPGQSPYMRADE